jgi:hypothetical protein
VSQIGWPLVTAAVTSTGRKLLLVPTANGPGDRRWLFGYSRAAGGHVESVDGTAERMIFPGRLLFNGCDARVKRTLTVMLLQAPGGSVYARPEVWMRNYRLPSLT